MQNILIVDDHIIIRSGLKMLLSDQLPAYAFHEAEDGVTALTQVKKYDFTLIIMDISMPGTDTEKLVSSIIALKPSTRILMFSMNSESLYAKRYLKLGVKGYI